MSFEIIAKYKCEKPKMIIDSIINDEIVNNRYKIQYDYEESFVIVKMYSEDLKLLQKVFNSFSQRFKLASDTYDFCFEN